MSSGAPGIVVAVPVMRNGRLAYVLTGALALDVFSKALRAQDIPPEWIASILDRNATIVARSRAAEQFVGRMATGALEGRIRMRMEGHPRPGVFTDRHEQLMASVAAQAAVAIDNASLYRKAQQAIQLRDDFLSVASHELKTPLTPLRLQLHLLSKKIEASPTGVSGETAVAAIDRMMWQVSRLARLVDELLDVSRIASGRLELHPEEVEPERVRTGSTLTVHVERPIVGVWDRGRIEQLLTNLVSNALKYGAGKPVAITASVMEGWAILTVRDHGIGIAPEDQERIFERFERAVSVRK